MFSFRPVLYVLGIVLVTLAVTMLFPLMVDYSRNDANWTSFSFSFFITLFFGVILILMNRQTGFDLSVRQIFLLTVACWVGVSFFASIPFVLSSASISFTDSVFEVVSGITTTGASVLKDIEGKPHGLLLWRAILQAIGGMGFVVAAMLFLPFMRVGGMQLYSTESSESDKFMPRTVQVAGNIAGTYILLIVLCAFFYHIAGMDIFDAICHAFTTLPTGGFSNHDASIAYFDSVPIQLVAIVFMLAGGLPFILILRAFKGNVMALWEDSQVKFFIKTLGLSILSLTLYLMLTQGRAFWQTLLDVTFHVVSISTTTGYVTQNFNEWGTFGVLILFFFMFMGGCSGSTTSGIKAFRIKMLKDTVGINIKKMIYPHAALKLIYNGKTVSNDVLESIKTFFFVYLTTFCFMTLLVSLSGLSFETAIASTAQAIGNIGVGFGPDVGPHTNFANIPDSSKWVLAVTMLMGRLELLNVMVLFTPFFWKR